MSADVFWDSRYEVLCSCETEFLRLLNFFYYPSIITLTTRKLRMSIKRLIFLETMHTISNSTAYWRLFNARLAVLLPKVLTLCGRWHCSFYLVRVINLTFQIFFAEIVRVGPIQICSIVVLEGIRKSKVVRAYWKSGLYVTQVLFQLLMKTNRRCCHFYVNLFVKTQTAFQTCSSKLLHYYIITSNYSKLKQTIFQLYK